MGAAYPIVFGIEPKYIHRAHTYTHTYKKKNDDTLILEKHG